MRIAVCPGSFDPITNGHIDIIKRAATLFDRVIVLVSENKSKNATFSDKQRLEFVKRATKDLENVEADLFHGLLADYVKEKNAVAIVKGLRAVSDFEYEFQMALVNKKLYDGAETVFLTANSDYMYLSSSMVRQIASFGGDISEFVPECNLEEINRCFGKE